MQHIIITGGAGGIGTELVKSLIDKRYYLLIIGRNEEKYHTLKSLLSNKDNIEFFKIDISNNDFVQEFYHHQINNDLFALINMSAVQPPISKFSNCKLEEWSKNLSINLLGTANMIHGFINTIQNNNQKRKIINFSGGGATSPRPNFSAYAASKASVVNFTESLSYELRSLNIDINAVSPGLINTNMIDEIINIGEKAGRDYKIALEKKNNGFDDINKIIELCNYLLSSDSDGISGKIISAIWDDYKNKVFINRLKNDSDFCSLRRVDSTNFDRIN